MAVRLNKGSTGSRVQVGAAVLVAARAVDTKLVEERLDRFAQAHRNFTAAQKKVDAAETEFTAAMTGVEGRGAVQATAVDALARALIADGHTRRGNPFAAFGAPTPSDLARLAFPEGAVATHQLAAAVLRAKHAGPAVVEAAQAADKAATAVEEALVPIAKLTDTVRDARRMRDTMGKIWDTALSALRRSARAAADDGATELYARLFPTPTRGSKTKAPPSGDVPPATDTKAA